MKKRLVCGVIAFVCMCNMVACGNRQSQEVVRANRPAGSQHDTVVTVDTDLIDDEVDDEPSASSSITNEDFLRNDNIYRTEEKGDGNDFNVTARMVDELSEAGGVKNTIVSQTSLNYALCLLQEGANGVTKDSITTYLDDSYLAANGLNYSARCNDTINSYLNNEAYTLNIANSVWTDEGISLVPSYVDTVSQYYNGTAQNLDFMAPGAADTINEWCDAKTNHLIKEIVTDSIMQQSRNILVNALYFNGTWEDSYEAYQVDAEEFTNVNGQTSMKDMLHSTESAYYENDQAIAYSKVYEGNDIIFVGILPKLEDGQEIGDFRLGALDINSLMASKTYEYDVYAVVPKFTVEDENSITDYLKANGLEDVFSENADFSTMCTDTDLYVTDVIQKTYVDVNEEGTEAAAATAIMMTDSCAMIDEPKEIKEVILDRPFAFMIYDTANDEVLFMGKVLDIE